MPFDQNKMKKKPILIAIPHPSTFVPAELRRLMNLTDKDLLRYSDSYADEIFEVPNAYCIKGKISRLVTDLNRAPDHIEMQYQLANDGVVVSVTEDEKQIYETPPTLEQIFERVKKYHDTFHADIEELSPKMKFLIDGHSLLSTAPATKKDAGKPRADIVLGNRHFTSCSREMSHFVHDFFADKGLSVTINDPYEGMYVLGYHCSRRGLPGIQIEINRKLYMNEKTLAPHKTKIREFNRMIRELVDALDKEITRQDKAE